MQEYEIFGSIFYSQHVILSTTNDYVHIVWSINMCILLVVEP